MVSFILVRKVNAIEQNGYDFNCTEESLMKSPDRLAKGLFDLYYRVRKLLMSVNAYKVFAFIQSFQVIEGNYLKGVIPQINLFTENFAPQYIKQFNRAVAFSAAV